MHREELLETRDIKLVRGLMVKVFFAVTQMNGVFQQKFQKLTPVIVLKSREWQL